MVRGRWASGAAILAAIAGILLLALAATRPAGDSPDARRNPVRVATPSVSAHSAAWQVPAGLPTRVVVIARSGRKLVDAPVVPVELDRTGVLAPPAGDAGWYAEPGWPVPGASGTAIVAGHANTVDGPDTFWHLPKSRPGDRIVIGYPSGRTVRFVVRRSAAQSKKTVVQDDSIWGQQGSRPRLRLITCDPASSLVSGHYADNWVVWATRIDRPDRQPRPEQETTPD